MLSFPLIVKLSIISLIWTQNTIIYNMFMKIVPNEMLSNWFSLTILLIIIHIVDVYYYKLKNK
jgi:hypothetical protein